jgi:hypothetical protein
MRNHDGERGWDSKSVEVGEKRDRARINAANLDQTDLW